MGLQKGTVGRKVLQVCKAMNEYNLVPVRFSTRQFQLKADKHDK